MAQYNKVLINNKKEGAEVLEEKLQENAESDIYPFHMPGHKRRLMGSNPYRIDITEIEGFDNLHHSQGILREAQEKAARLYGSKKAYYLVNGSTCGILAAVSAATKKRDKVIVGRNSHKAVYNALYLNELVPTYVYPVITETGIQGQIQTKAVKKAIEETKDASAVIITSPTYDGVSSDVREIAELAHANGMILIVDSAHGAHFGFGYGTPENVIDQGADLVIESLHKTLPAYTQTALLHLCSDRVSPQAVEKYLDIYETSSPSYVLMAGIEKCIDIVEKQKDQLFGGLERSLDVFYSKVSGLKHLKVMTKADFKPDEISDFDRSKIIILTDRAGMSGQDLWDVLLHKYHIQIEMAAGSYGVALSSVMDTEEGFGRLADALIDMDNEIEAGIKAEIKIENPGNGIVNAQIYSPNERSLEIFEAEESGQATGMQILQVPLDAASGQVSGAYINLYPPGIPLIVPGEIISQPLVENLKSIIKLKLDLQGLTDNNFITILKG